MTTSPGAQPVPQIDEDPDPGNEVGGTDAIAGDTTIPPLTPDVPRSAQMNDDDVPDELKEPEGPDREANLDDPSSEPSG
ncbi:MAG: hypothetical protein JWP74_3356 [Marmoricola sp.]|nr:hypothetical protein [Marmoricola sp.]